MNYAHISQSCEGTIAKLRGVFEEMGRPDAIKVVDCCLEERANRIQHPPVPGGRAQSGIRTAPGVRSLLTWIVLMHVLCIN